MNVNQRDWEKDDFFLDQLAQGQDPSQGKDPLAAALLGLRTEIESEMPAAPKLPADWAVEPHVAQPHSAQSHAAQPQADAPDELADARRRRAARGTHRAPRRGFGLGIGAGASRRFGWTSALVGAAAATALFAVGSLSVYHATPNSPLWGMHQALFDDEKAARIELASTLQQLEDSANRGDEEATRKLIAEARTLLENLRERKEAKQSKGAGENKDRGEQADNDGKAAKTKTTVTRVRPQPEGESEPQTVTETKEVTVTKTVAPAQQNPQAVPGGGGLEPQPRPSGEPSVGEQPPAQPQQPLSPTQPDVESREDGQRGQGGQGAGVAPGNDHAAPAGPENQASTRGGAS